MFSRTWPRSCVPPIYWFKYGSIFPFTTEAFWAVALALAKSICSCISSMRARPLSNMPSLIFSIVCSIWFKTCRPSAMSVYRFMNSRIPLLSSTFGVSPMTCRSNEKNAPWKRIAAFPCSFKKASMFCGSTWIISRKRESSCAEFSPRPDLTRLPSRSKRRVANSSVMTAPSLIWDKKPSKLDWYWNFIPTFCSCAAESLLASGRTTWLGTTGPWIRGSGALFAVSVLCCNGLSYPVRGVVTLKIFDIFSPTIIFILFFAVFGRYIN